MREAPPDLVPVEQLDVVEAEPVLALDELALPLDQRLVAGAEEIALAAAGPGRSRAARPARRTLVQLDALADEGDLLGVVELEPEGAGRRRRRQRGRARPRVHDDGPEAGPRRAERRRAADHAGADDDQVGRGRQDVAGAEPEWAGGLGGHRAVSSRHVPGSATWFAHGRCRTNWSGRRHALRLFVD